MDYRIQEADFSLPEGSLDQSLNVLTLMPENASPFSLTISRKPATPGQNLAEHVVANIMTAEDQDDGFDLLWKRTVELDSHPAIILATRIGNHSQPVSLRRICVLHGPVFLTITASVQGDFASPQLDALNSFRRSFRFTKRPAPAPQPESNPQTGQ
ncbi:DcrB-related protein [Acetobacter sp. AN02]|uniref:DcrB-related protein n=1 Tax=Acetobacter sp. AN02 TaxID=2894186 RepID=UPI0024342BA0|nr:DcrB-related protein [Acetobacter sp. AN02]MDG6093845.1 DcrB-related protein [Acetobacter sp. AN02]